jgi:hypothetical protein
LPDRGSFIGEGELSQSFKIRCGSKLIGKSRAGEQEVRGVKAGVTGDRVMFSDAKVTPFAERRLTREAETNTETQKGSNLRLRLKFRPNYGIH